VELRTRCAVCPFCSLSGFSFALFRFPNFEAFEEKIEESLPNDDLSDSTLCKVSYIFSHLISLI